MIPAIIVFVLGASSGLWPLFIIAVLWVIAVAVVMTAMNAVFQTALYLYATTGEVPSGFSGNELPAAFGPKTK